MSGSIGLIVNPLAGLGGVAGVGGSDGAEAQSAARARGGVPRAPDRAARFTTALRRLMPDARVLAGAGELGADADPLAETVGARTEGPTEAADTVALAQALSARGVDLLVFVGGDGTARDVLRGVPPGQVCLGVPAGVKMHSGVFAVTPEDAARQAVEVLAGSSRSAERDVVDIDEAARREGVLSTSIYGTLLVPDHTRMQRGKRSPAHSGGFDAAGAAAAVRDEAGTLPIVFGPGTTVSRVAERFGVTSTLLGCDVLLPSGEVYSDQSGAALERLLADLAFAVVLSPIGGQGFVLGRGNHQLTERLLEALDPRRLILVAEAAKLGELGGTLRIDAPSPSLNDKFRGPVRVVLGGGDVAVGRIE